MNSLSTLPFRKPLTADQQRSAGIPDPWPLATADQVRFGEIDMLGHVNNAAYLTWFETLRTTYLEFSGLTSYTATSDPRIVIRSGEIHWMQEMLRDEIYVVTARAIAYRNTSFTLRSEIWSGTCRARFDCVTVTLEQDGKTRRKLPATFIERIAKIDGAQQA